MPGSARDLDQLRELLDRREIAVFIGAGVTIQATNNAPASSWVGLIASGVDYIMRARPDVDAEALKEKISNAEVVDDYLAVADEIAFRLGGRSGFNFRQWLEEAIGSLSPTPTGVRLLKSILNLRNPIITTNYDGLLEEASGSVHRSYTWRDAYSIAEVMRGHRSGIIHLHGHFDQPADLVFDQRSYIELLRDQKYRDFRSQLLFGSSMMFVGCGEGLNDPNFHRWREALQEYSNELKRPCYRLCLESELPALARRHRYDDFIRLVPYGTEHAHLTDFLSALAPPLRLHQDAKVTFIEPAEVHRCAHEVPVSGTVTGIDPMIDLWLVKEISTDNYHPDNGPLRRAGDTWAGVAYLGNIRPIAEPTQYKLFLMTATRDATRRLQAYLSECMEFDIWPGISDLTGMVPIAEIMLTRDH